MAGFSERRYMTANRTVPRGEPVEDTRLTRTQILAACDASLRRLQAPVPASFDWLLRSSISPSRFPPLSTIEPLPS